jgi:hypothetical protein
MKTLKTYGGWWLGGLLVLAITITPLARPEWFAAPLAQSTLAKLSGQAGLVLLPLIAAITVLWSYPATRKEKAGLVLLCLLAANYCEHLHHQFVDLGRTFPSIGDNTTWQRLLQAQVMALDPGAIPHSYRFFSHSVVAIFQWLSGDFEFARWAYRALFNTLLFATAFRYARLYLTQPAAVATIVLLVTIYPATIVLYAGQFVDPASHFSFVACLYFFARNYEPGVAPTLALGVLAKESVIALSVCRAFYGPNRLRSAVLAALYFSLGLGVAVAVRYVINRHSFQYDRVSGVGMDHVVTNLLHGGWRFPYVFTLGLLLPGAVIGWRLMDRRFQFTCIVLTSALIISSALFSWLQEVRNLVPALIMLLVINVKLMEQQIIARWPQGALATAKPEQIA